MNGGGAVSRGVELASAASLTNALRLRGSWSYTRAELSQDSPGLLDGGADAFEGDRLAGAPRQQGSLLASYATLLGRDVAFEVQYGYSYIGDVLTRIGMRAGGEALPAYDVHNVSASISKDDWTDRGRLPVAPLLRQRAGPAAYRPARPVHHPVGRRSRGRAFSRPRRPSRRSPPGWPAARYG